MVKGWQIYIQVNNNPANFNNRIEELKGGHDEMKAILIVFGDAINMFITDTGRSDYHPLHSTKLLINYLKYLGNNKLFNYEKHYFKITFSIAIY
jgi:hypothetical protein